MKTCQTYSDAHSTDRIKVEIKGAVFVRIGVCQVTHLPLRTGGDAC